MSSKRRIRKNSCDGKQRHDNSKSAYAHLSKLRVKDGAYGMNVYKCQFCKGYHVGHLPNKIKGIITRKKY